MVRPHDEQQLRSLQPVTPLLERELDDEELSISHVLVPLWGS